MTWWTVYHKAGVDRVGADSMTVFESGALLFWNIEGLIIAAYADWQKVEHIDSAHRQALAKDLKC